MLILKSPYFSTLLSSSFAGVEIASGTITLDSAVDTDSAFQMFVEFLYHSNYDPPKGVRRDGRCLLHASVYVLAERLCMEDLKSLALVKMVKELADKGASRLRTGTIVQLTAIVYENTPDLYAQSDEDQKSVVSAGRTPTTDGQSLGVPAPSRTEMVTPNDSGAYGRNP
jgi:hypothetical protein